VVPEDIVFASSRSGNGDIYKMTPGSPAAPEQLTTGSAIDAEPAWSPNRQQVAFTSTRDGGSNMEIYTIDNNPLNPTPQRQTNHPRLDLFPDW
jgi:Tol biopolymer transport system component